MFKNLSLPFIVVTQFLFTGANAARAADEPAATQNRKQDQAQEQNRTRQQAIESVKQRLKENPRDEGLRHAERCLADGAQCQNLDDVDRALESVRRDMDRHPDDAGLRHAMTRLEQHHQRLEKQHMERGRSMHRGGSTRPDRPDHHYGSEGMHR